MDAKGGGRKTEETEVGGKFAQHLEIAQRMCEVEVQREVDFALRIRQIGIPAVGSAAFAAITVQSLHPGSYSHS